MTIDWTLLSLLNDLVGRSAVFDLVVRLLVNDYAITTALIVVPFGLWFDGATATERQRNQRAALSAVASMFLANLFIKALNLVYYRPRPFASHDLQLLFYHPSDSSFPSNPTSVGFCIATAVWLSNRRAGWVLYALASLLGLARLIGGVHYPSDILGGAVVGSLSAYLVVRKLGFMNRLWTIVIRQARRFLLA
jgi:undecaprenyl-diphosphatase